MANYILITLLFLLLFKKEARKICSKTVSNIFDIIFLLIGVTIYERFSSALKNLKKILKLKNSKCKLGEPCFEAAIMTVFIFTIACILDVLPVSVGLTFQT